MFYLKFLPFGAAAEIFFSQEGKKFLLTVFTLHMVLQKKSKLNYTYIGNNNVSKFFKK